MKNRKRKDLFNPYAVNPDRLPGEPFNPPDMNWQSRPRNPVQRVWFWVLKIIPGGGRQGWTVHDWTMAAAVIGVLLILAKMFL